ncbi:MAG TPA: apolipoprotein N-acyltransferase [Candidatus Binatia bacterium]|nr:apolipoprotein N-acyltransferase [Candidatus Binatia bacterium]
MSAEVARGAGAVVTAASAGVPDAAGANAGWDEARVSAETSRRPGRAWASRLASAALGGVLYFLGYVGFGAWPLIFVFLVPLWCALESVPVGRPGRGRSARAVAALGFAFGLVAYAGGFAWLWKLVEVFLAGNLVLGGALWALYGAWFAAGFALYAIAFAAIRRRGWPVAIAGTAPLVVLEWLQPMIFPVNAGSALIHTLPLVQIADLGGPLLLTAFVATVNVIAFETWSWWRDRRARPVRWWVGGATLVGAVLLYGFVRTREVEAWMRDARELRVGIVQANLGLMEKREQGIVSHERHLEMTRELLAGGELDLVVWPETAYVRGIRRPLPVSGRLVVRDLGVPLLFGGTSVEEEGGRRVAYNSTFLVGSDGMIRDAYDKNLPIPLAEYAPLGWLFPAIAGWLPHVQDFAASSETPPLRLGPARIATPICYEVVRPDFVGRMVRASRPHVIVTIANDAWFGDSQEPWLHLHLARLRAIEHRRYLVRATNSGVSAIVEPTGRISARTGVGARATLRASVRSLEGGTLYAAAGDWPGWLATLLVVATLCFDASSRRRIASKPTADVTPGAVRVSSRGRRGPRSTRWLYAK